MWKYLRLRDRDRFQRTESSDTLTQQICQKTIRHIFPKQTNENLSGESV